MYLWSHKSTNFLARKKKKKKNAAASLAKLSQFTSSSIGKMSRFLRTYLTLLNVECLGESLVQFFDISKIWDLFSHTSIVRQLSFEFQFSHIAALKMKRKMQVSLHHTLSSSSRGKLWKEILSGVTNGTVALLDSYLLYLSYAFAFNSGVKGRRGGGGAWSTLFCP